MPKHAIFLALAVFLAAPALAQQDAAPALANFHGLTPTEIICMATGEDGQPEEVSSTPWEGGEIAADACPPGATPLHSYAAEAVSDADSSGGSVDAKPGGTD